MSDAGDRNATAMTLPLRVATAIELTAHVGRDLAPGRWRVVTQDEIDRFVALTGDRNWIHSDVARAARDLPGGNTVVPGQLLLAMVPGLLQEAYVVTGGAQGHAAAIRTVRFRRAVAPGETFRLRVRLTRVRPHPRFVQVDAACNLETAAGQTVLTSQRSDVFVGP